MSDNNGNGANGAVLEGTQSQVKKSFCKYCGGDIVGAPAFCPSCGKPQGSVAVQRVPLAPVMDGRSEPLPTQQAQSHSSSSQSSAHSSSQTTSNTVSTQTTVIVKGSGSNGWGTAGLVFALLSFFVCWIPVVDIVIWFLGALFSFIGLFKSPRGAAIAGFILSFIGIFILVTFFGAILGLSGAL